MIQEIVLTTLLFAAPLYLICCVPFFRPLMKHGWESYLAWEAVPLLQFPFLFVLVASINWPYESKLLLPRNAVGLNDIYLGPILLAFGLGFAVLAGFLLLLMRRLLRRIFSPNGRWYLWLSAAVLGLGILLLTVEGASTVLLGPAAITMRDQMTTVPIR
jgi:hypothetical protein